MKVRLATDQFSVGAPINVWWEVLQQKVESALRAKFDNVELVPGGFRVEDFVIFLPFRPMAWNGWAAFLLEDVEILLPLEEAETLMASVPFEGDPKGSLRYILPTGEELTFESGELVE